MIATAIAVLILVAALVQLGYALYFFCRIYSSKAVTANVATPRSPIPAVAQLPVSVVICAKNEAENLTENLPYVLEQYYQGENGLPFFEVIVVNDQSTDDSIMVLAELGKRYPHLKVVNIPAEEIRDLPGKKFALHRAVRAATHDFILMTDADCRPASKDWISWMSYPFGKDKEIVAGHGGYYARPGLLNKFIRCETTHTQLQYFTYNLASIPYMAVGRNLACKKELLLQAETNLLWTQTASGDDDLLIRLCATGDNMVVNVDPASFTWSEAKNSWESWVKQKQRHFSTGKLYQKKVQLLLGGYALSHALLWVGCIAFILLAASDDRPPIPFLLFQSAFLTACARFSLMWITWTYHSTRIERPGLKYYWPFFDFAWLLYNFIFAPWIFWKNKQQWT